MTLMPMGICYLTWFETLRRLPPTSALDRHAAGARDRRGVGGDHPRRAVGAAREIGAMALTLGGVTLALQRAWRPRWNGRWRIAFSTKGSLAMRKALAQLDAEQKAQLALSGGSRHGDVHVGARGLCT